MNSQPKLLKLLYLRCLAETDPRLYLEKTSMSIQELTTIIREGLTGKLNEPQLFWNEILAALSEKDSVGVVSLGRMCLIRYNHLLNEARSFRYVDVEL